jgi:drug/metabolite transporter (DMT)-like permease
MRQKLKVYGAMSAAMMFWGFSFIWTRQVLIVYQPITTIFFRLLLSSVFMLTINLFIKQYQKIRREDYLQFLFLSFFQPFLYFIGENYGLVYVSSTVTSVIISTIPLFSPIAAYFFLKEKMKIMNFIGILISIVGVLFVIFKKGFTLSASPIGILFLALAVFSAVIYSVIIVRLSEKYNVFTIISTQNTIGIALFLPIFLIMDFSGFRRIGFNAGAFIPIVELAIFASTMAFLFFIYGIQKLGIVKSNILANIIPVFTAIFAYFLIDEKLNSMNILGILIVILGLIVTQLTRERIRNWSSIAVNPQKWKKFYRRD